MSTPADQRSTPGEPRVLSSEPALGEPHAATGEPPIGEPRALRRDAARNRAAIVAAARSACDEHGGAADVRDIARRAGVGMGTLYRHFPAKEELLAEVLHEQFETWTEAVRRAAAATDPWTALTDFFHQALRGCARQHAVMDSVVGGWCRPSEEAATLGVIIDELLDRANAAGLLRPGVTRADLLLLLQSLGYAVKVTRDDGSWQRLVHISLDGLRAVHTAPVS
ncbi:TetR/AcrR family transcriptional regulator [Actinoplanes sp. N902-109]|uniref:TetR/AcrR family transcriptional regulator n=1 Tax=Actinoplanes sp. (strain N902-109) TaxID=649831 RepID=UPI00032938C6|nr:TetR/AcrR family transcriptional regulator [Actinoplanes sp. N902-109]AGL20157.1 transcriptional regulator [Actinoplanes sp. N902-109]